MKIFSLLVWFSLTIHLSLFVSEVSYKPPHLTYNFSFSFFFNFFINTFCMWNLSWLNMSALTLIWQAQQQQQQQQQQCNVVQICVLKLTAHRALVLYDAYVAVLTLITVDDDSVLFVDQQQLVQYTHFSQTMVILALLSVNVLFVQLCITLNQVRTHWLSYINVILIQSWDVLVSVDCINCQTHSMTLFLKCHHTSEHFSECCNNCKWRDHAACCSVCNNDVLIVISDNENNNSVNENEHAA